MLDTSRRSPPVRIRSFLAATVDAEIISAHGQILSGTSPPISAYCLRLQDIGDGIRSDSHAIRLSESAMLTAETAADVNTDQQSTHAQRAQMVPNGAPRLHVSAWPLTRI